MNYIIFDMEWNQPSSAKEKNPDLIRGEIIQIGFFVLNDSFDILFKDNIIIKPACYKSINQYVEYLTGISQDMLNKGLCFKEALEIMAHFFTEDTILFTWGDDDMPILRQNMKFHGIDNITLPKHYNLQRFYSIQANTATRQTALKTAAEHFGIDIDIQAHDALNDAYLTLLVAKKLDIARGIAEYDKAAPVSSNKPKKPWDTSQLYCTIEQEFSKNIGALPDTCKSVAVTCENCKETLIFGNLCRYGKNTFITIAECVCGNRYFVISTLKENILCTNVYELDSKTEKLYTDKIHAKESRKRYYQCKTKKK